MLAERYRIVDVIGQGTFAVFIEAEVHFIYVLIKTLILSAFFWRMFSGRVGDVLALKFSTLRIKVSDFWSDCVDRRKSIFLFEKTLFFLGSQIHERN